MDRKTKILGENSKVSAKSALRRIASSVTSTKRQMAAGTDGARSRRREAVYQAAMLDPHTAAQLSLDDIVKMCDELIDAHGEYMKMYR